jgi:hypothetical protein
VSPTTKLYLDAQPQLARLSTRRVLPMVLNSILIAPIIALLAGILILVMPRLLNFVVAIYLIIVGVIGLAPHFIR